jgi:hypothetical protein
VRTKFIQSEFFGWGITYMEKLIILFGASVAAILSVIGFVYLSRMIARVNRECTNLALIGLILILMGWITEVLWEILIVLTDKNFRFLDHSFYIFLAPGMICVAWALWNSFRATGNVPIWVVPVIMIIVIEGATLIRALSKGGKSWLFVLLAATSVIFLAINFQLIWESFRRGFKGLALLFIVTSILTIVHFGFIRWWSSFAVSIWIIQLSSVLMWAGFSYAVRSLSKNVAP